MHFDGWPKQYDEWIEQPLTNTEGPGGESRIAPHHSHTKVTKKWQRRLQREAAQREAAAKRESSQ